MEENSVFFIHLTGKKVQLPCCTQPHGILSDEEKLMTLFFKRLGEYSVDCILSFVSDSFYHKPTLLIVRRHFSSLYNQEQAVSFNFFDILKSMHNQTLKLKKSL